MTFCPMFVVNVNILVYIMKYMSHADTAQATELTAEGMYVLRKKSMEDVSFCGAAKTLKTGKKARRERRKTLVGHSNGLGWNLNVKSAMFISNGLKISIKSSSKRHSKLPVSILSVNPTAGNWMNSLIIG